MTNRWPRLLKRRRTQLMRAELLIHLAMAVDRWADQVMDQDPAGSRPFAEWDPTDPLVTLVRTYRSTPRELADVLRDVAISLEARGTAAGYEHHLDPMPPPPAAITSSRSRT